MHQQGQGLTCLRSDGLSDLIGLLLSFITATYTSWAWRESKKEVVGAQKAGQHISPDSQGQTCMPPWACMGKIQPWTVYKSHSPTFEALDAVFCC